MNLERMIYPLDFETKIGFDRIREIVLANCLSQPGRDRVDAITFLNDRSDIQKLLSQNSEFQQILQLEEDFPLDYFFDMRDSLNKLRLEGSYPDLAEVFKLKRSLITLKAIYSFFQRREEDKNDYPSLTDLCREIKVYPFVQETIERMLNKEGGIRDNASPELNDIRSGLKKAAASVSKKMHTILKKSQTDGIVEKGTAIAIRNGRGVIPVSVYDKNKIRGLVHDQSASGKTVYIEPEEIVALNNQIIEFEYAEKREIIKILLAFADKIRPYIDDLLHSYDIMGEIDMIRAKAVLGRKLESLSPVLHDIPFINWIGARHPLLSLAFEESPEREVIPLDITLNEEDRIIIISGPNAGGKSVCLKTVGLLQYMLQCGFTIPVKQGSEFGIFNKLFIDIGDEQSIENDLSTYSSHLVNMKYFVKHSDKNTLVLIDEFGTGTEPMLGGAIAEAILGNMNKLGLYGVITTHYTNLKHYASSVEGITNGAMMFDNHRMQALFRLDIGKPGSSFAFEIARKIGLPESILGSASEKVGEDHISFDKHLKDILRDKRYWDQKRQNIRKQNKKLEELIENYEAEMSGLKSERKEIISRAKEEADLMISSTNKTIENTIKEIKEAQAEKEKTREARKKIEDLRKGIDEKQSGEDEKIKRKMKKLREKQERIKVPGKEAKKQSEAPVRKPDSGPLKAGDKVLMEGSNRVGEVINVERKKIIIAFGNISTSVDRSKVRKASHEESKSAERDSRSSVKLDWDISKRKGQFKPETDIRGMRAEDALRTVRELVDEAIMVQYPKLRVLHGKGDGILRHVIREYLSGVDLVKASYDEHVEAGGSGITIVEMDV